MGQGKKTVLITGGNSGLGLACAKKIAASQEYQVVLACRSLPKGERAKEEVAAASGSRAVSVMQLDVSSLASVRTFAESYRAQQGPLAGLVCNAGIVGLNTGLTPEGLDVVFATNHLGHFLLTLLLLPALEPQGRIAVVSSDMHCPPGAALTWPGALALARPQPPLAEDRSRYSFSKLCNLYFTHELAARLKALGAGITINALNPGLMPETNFAPDKARFTPEFLQAMADRVGSVESSSGALAGLVTGPAGGETSGAYYDRKFGPIPSSPLSYDGKNARELWDVSVQLTGLTEGETLPGLLACEA